MLGSMPAQVREAREAAWGIAGFGIAYPAVMGLFIDADAAKAASTQFCCSWILGLVVFGFAGRWDRASTLAITLAFLQAVVCVRARDDAIPVVLWIVAVVYSIGVCAAIACLLRRPAAKAWFAVGISPSM
jgi:hypothetical protein